MIVLALDTATPSPGAALLVGDEVFEATLPGDRRASEELFPAIARCLAGAGITVSRIDRVAACAGPGSFTGLRIGLAAAWGLARGTGAPLETVSTLEAIAETARGSFASVTAALDAGRGEVVVAEFALDGERARPLGGPRRIPLADARALAARGGAIALPEDLLGPAPRAVRPSPARALALAVERAPRAPTGPGVTAVYSRPSAAEEKLGAS